MVWPLTPRSLATSATFLPDAIRSRTLRLNSGGYLLGMPTSSGGHGHDESNDATPPKWGNIKVSTEPRAVQSGHRRRLRPPSPSDMGHPIRRKRLATMPPGSRLVDPP